VQYAARYVINTVPYGVIYKAWRDQPANVSFHFLPMTTKGTKPKLPMLKSSDSFMPRREVGGFWNGQITSITHCGATLPNR